MKLKRLLAVIIAAAVLAASFTACGGKEGKKNSASGEKSGAGEETGTEEQDAAYMERGTVTGTVYENKALGIRCDLGEDFTCATDQEIMQMSGITEELTDSSAVKEAINASSSIYDMYAYSADGTTSVNVVLENLTVLDQLDISEKEYAEKGVEQLETAFAQMDVSNVNTSVAEGKFAGTNHSFIEMSMQMEGNTIYQRQYCIKAKGMMGIVTFSSYDKAQLDTMIARFTAL